MRNLKKLLHPGDRFIYGYDRAFVHVVESVGREDCYGTEQPFAVDTTGHKWWTLDSSIIVLEDDFATWVKDIRREAEECQT